VLLLQDTFQKSFAVTNRKHITFSSREIRVLYLDLIRAVVNCVYVAGVEISKIQLLVSKLLNKLGIEGKTGFFFLVC